MPGDLVLVRHGETEWSAGGRHTGRTDVPLTDEGRRQAEALRARLNRWELAEVRSSPLRRALDTAKLAGLGDRLVVDPDLAEWDYGAVEGRTTAEMRQSVPGWSIWRDGPTAGESADDVGRRADRVLARVTPVLERDGNVALVAHGHLLRILAARWLGLDAGCGRLLALDPATLSVLGFEREQRVVLHWNVA